MAVRSLAAPPTPWSRELAEPTIDPSAYINVYTNIIGDVHIDANVHVAPGVSIRADEGTPFHIGENTNVQDGVVIHGLEKGRVLGDDGKEYSVWIGQNASITHMALVHGPVYVGDECFVGFRSTVFNARLGKGCVVMMHALVQDVEIAPGKYVPSGAVITTQQQADRLPDVQAVDAEFARHVVGINDALRQGYRCAADLACVAQLRNEGGGTPHQHAPSTPQSNGQRQSMVLHPQILEQVRHLLSQGHRIGIEHADDRRFRASSWLSGTTIQASREPEVIAAIEAQLREFSGEYVRLLGIDTKNKRRVLETIVQRPNGELSVPAPAASRSVATAYVPAASGNGRLAADTRQTVEQLLAQGFRIGTEHADERRFRANSWLSCAPITSGHAGEVLAALETCLHEHTGEYVRLLGIDTKNKRRVLETIIQRPNGQSAPAGGSAPAPAFTPTTSSYGGGSLGPEIVTQVRQLIAQGHRVGLEHADERRFRANSWLSGPTITGNHEGEVLVAVESALRELRGGYVRLLGIDTKNKRRVLETIIQRP